MSLLHHPRFTLYTSLLTLLIGVGLILWSGHWIGGIGLVMAYIGHHRMYHAAKALHGPQRDA